MAFPTRRRVHLLEITSVVPVVGTSLTFNVAAQTLNDGEVYVLDLKGVNIPEGLSGTEQVIVVVNNAPAVSVPVGTRLAKIFFSEALHRYKAVGMVYTDNSVIGTPAAPKPVFLAKLAELKRRV